MRQATRSHGFYVAALLMVAVLDPAAALAAGPEGDVLVPVRARIAELEVELKAALDGRLVKVPGENTSVSGSEPAIRARLMLRVGFHDDAHALVPQLARGDVCDRVLAGRILLAVNAFDEARPVIETLIDEAPDDPAVRHLAYRWWILTDDLDRVDREQKQRHASGNATIADELAAADLATMLLDFDAAIEIHGKALETLEEGDEACDLAPGRAELLEGLGVATYRKRDFDSSYDYTVQALEIAPPDPGLLMELSRTLIRLGRTQEAIDAAKLAVRIAPYHEGAHYLLGNGYADKNYTELHAAYPDAFADEAGREALEAADTLWKNGDPAAAREAYLNLAAAHPGWADVQVRLGSLDFTERDYDAAQARFARALGICPEYGRAHNGMAKALEAERLDVEVHRARYEAEFEALPMPRVESIDSFIVNWSALSPRHQKRVALSVDPWKRYIPVLLESGSTHYIKPLYELLSETPGQELLRDQRINYDSRLWDDVRGCGGYNTVTGIEDVERSVRNRYNTVLHELSHQVHAVMPAARKRQIQELYRRTKVRDEGGADAFLSRYAGGSVWEYLAEGANSLYSPRRDRYDIREIVRERLEEKDPALRDLVIELMQEADVDSCYPVAYTNRGDNLLEKGQADAAISSYAKAIERSPEEETALSSMIFALQVAGRTRDALALAEEKHAEQPESASLAIRHADAVWTGGVGLDSAIHALEESRSTVRGEEVYRIDLELGRLRWIAGDGAGSREAYRSVLEYQSDSPEGLWGMATAHALDGSWDEAWTFYEQAVRLRTGVVELRTDYALDLIRAGEPGPAREQVDAALLLDPRDPGAIALDAWLLAEDGDLPQALRRGERALEIGPWSDLARVVLARIHRERGDQMAMTLAVEPVFERIQAGSPPEYVYRSTWGRYDEVHTLPLVLRELLD